MEPDRGGKVFRIRVRTLTTMVAVAALVLTSSSCRTLTLGGDLQTATALTNTGPTWYFLRVEVHDCAEWDWGVSMVITDTDMTGGGRYPDPPSVSGLCQNGVHSGFLVGHLYNWAAEIQPGQTLHLLIQPYASPADIGRTISISVFGESCNGTLEQPLENCTDAITLA